MVPAENGMRSFSAGAVCVCSVQSTSGVALLRGRAVDLWGRFVASSVQSTSGVALLRLG